MGLFEVVYHEFEVSQSVCLCIFLPSSLVAWIKVQNSQRVKLNKGCVFLGESKGAMEKGFEVYTGGNNNNTYQR